MLFLAIKCVSFGVFKHAVISISDFKLHESAASKFKFIKAFRNWYDTIELLLSTMAFVTGMVSAISSVLMLDPDTSRTYLVISMKS